MTDFIICSKCHARLIIEEFDNHECTETYRFEGNYLLIRRKGNWRRIYLPSLGIFPEQPLGNKEKTTDNETEPNFTIVLYYAQSKSTIQWNMFTLH